MTPRTINKSNLIEIKNEIKKQKQNIKLIAVTKGKDINSIIASLKSGLKIIGESRVQEAEKKFKNIDQNIKFEKHLIGHLQSNKTKKAVELFDVIQTVDTIKLAKKINAVVKNKKQRILIQVNVGEDPKKHGFSIEDALIKIEEIKKLKKIKVEGIMMIAPQNKSKEELIRLFRKTKKTQEKLKEQIKECTQVSMGMSGDYKEAIAEGATYIRIGTALFN